MARENRIKEFTFTVPGSAATTALRTDYTHALNGEILQVDWKTGNTGSLFISLSGTPSTELFRRNAPSGAAWQSAYPRVFSETTTGSIAGAVHVPFVVNGPLAINTGSNISGTNCSFQLAIKYR